MRTRKAIDAEYEVIAKIYGDRVFKGSKLQEEIKALHERMKHLAAEPALPEAPAAIPEQKKNEPVAEENPSLHQPA